jgi:hypothetical protein
LRAKHRINRSRRSGCGGIVLSMESVSRALAEETYQRIESIRECAARSG